jgi:hypothetical protein
MPRADAKEKHTSNPQANIKAKRTPAGRQANTKGKRTPLPTPTPELTARSSSLSPTSTTTLLDDLRREEIHGQFLAHGGGLNLLCDAAKAADEETWAKVATEYAAAESLIALLQSSGGYYHDDTDAGEASDGTVSSDDTDVVDNNATAVASVCNTGATASITGTTLSITGITPSIAETARKTVGATLNITAIAPPSTTRTGVSISLGGEAASTRVRTAEDEMRDIAEGRVVPPPRSRRAAARGD